MKRKGIAFCLTVSLLAVSLLLSSNIVYAGSLTNWEFVYENDSSGNTVSGSWDKLAAAIKKGADVKVMYSYPNSPEIVIIAQLAIVDRSNNLVYVLYETLG